MIRIERRNISRLDGGRIRIRSNTKPIGVFSDDPNDPNDIDVHFQCNDGVGPQNHYFMILEGENKQHDIDTSVYEHLASIYNAGVYKFIYWRMD